MGKKSGHEIEQLKRALSESAKPYPLELRRRAVAAARQEMVAGETLNGASRKLGMSALTLRMWLSDAPSFEEVSIVGVQPTSRVRLVHERSGVVVEGLDVSAIVEVLRRLG